MTAIRGVQGGIPYFLMIAGRMQTRVNREQAPSAGLSCAGFRPFRHERKKGARFAPGTFAA